MDFDRKLIYAVKKRRVLYNSHHKNYRNHFLRNKLWHKIAKELNVEVNHCQKRWTNLKRRYTTEYNIKKSFDAAGLKLEKKLCAYYNMLHFLNPYIYKKIVTSNNDSTLDVVMDNASPIKIRIKANNIASNQCSSCHAEKKLQNTNLIDKKCIESEQDNVDTFLRNLSPILKSFDLKTRLEVEIDLNRIILKKLREK